MPLLCESEAGCAKLAAVNVTILAPTGESIDTDTGTDPVLSPVMSGRLCAECGSQALAMGTWLTEYLGGHAETSPLEPDEVLELDPITLAKGANDAILAGVVSSRTVRLPGSIRTWPR